MVRRGKKKTERLMKVRNDRGVEEEYKQLVCMMHISNYWKRGKSEAGRLGRAGDDRGWKKRMKEDGEGEEKDGTVKGKVKRDQWESEGRER